MAKIKAGDMVDCYKTIWRKGEPVSRHHIVTSIVYTESDRAMAYITGGEGYVSCERLVLSDGWTELVFEDTGLADVALDMIAAEDISQRELWGNQTHTGHRWMTILTEEVGELAKAILENNLAEIAKEGTQVATLALKIAWMARKMLEGEHG